MPDKKAAKAAGPDAIMAPAEMKPILALSKRGTPISCAIALTKEKEGVILLHKKLKPKKLLAVLKKEAADAGLALETTTLRFGRAEVDVDVDPGLLTLIVNKDAPGVMRPKLLEQVRKAGYKAVEITIDSGLENEPEEEDQSAGAQDAAGPAPDAATSGSPAASPTSAPGSSPPQSSDPARTTTPPSSPPASASQPTAAALAQALTDLVRRLVAVASSKPQAAAELKTLATKAQASLKSGDLAGAASCIESLRRQLDSAVPSSPGTAGSSPPSAQSPGAATTTSPPPPQTAGVPQQDAGALTQALTALIRRLAAIAPSNPQAAAELKALALKAQASLKSGDLAGAVASIETFRQRLEESERSPTTPTAPPQPSPALTKARLVWVATRQKVDSDLGQLHAAFSSAFKAHARQADLTKAFRIRVDSVLDTLDESLAHKLDDLNGAADPGERAKLVREARSLIDGYSKHVASDETIAALDKNPFVPLSIQKTMTATLAALSKAIR
jgi:predicted RecB family endonuclease